MGILSKLFGLLCVASILLTGCQKEEEFSRDNFIKAGQKDFKVTYQDFKPDIQIEMTNDGIDNTPTNSYSGQLMIDLDRNRVNDVEFYSFYGVGHPMGSAAPSEGCRIRSISENMTVEITTEPLLLNDRIDQNLDWFNLSDFGSESDERSLLSSYTPEWNDSPEIIKNPWESTGQYLGFRMIHESDTLYGWLSIQIEDYYNLTVKEAGIID